MGKKTKEEKIQSHYDKRYVKWEAKKRIKEKHKDKTPEGTFEDRLNDAGNIIIWLTEFFMWAIVPCLSMLFKRLRTPLNFEVPPPGEYDGNYHSFWGTGAIYKVQRRSRMMANIWWACRVIMIRHPHQVGFIMLILYMF